MRKIYKVRHYKEMIMLVKRILRRQNIDEGTRILMEQRLEQYNILLEDAEQS